MEKTLATPPGEMVKIAQALDTLEDGIVDAYYNTRALVRSKGFTANTVKLLKERMVTLYAAYNQLHTARSRFTGAIQTYACEGPLNEEAPHDQT